MPDPLVVTSLAVKFCNKGQKGDVTGALDGLGQLALMLGARASLASRPDLAATAHIAIQQRQILVVDCLNIFSAELADFLASGISTSPTSVVTHACALLIDVIG
jgi:hypothetical protein